MPPNSLQMRENSEAGMVHSEVKLSSGIPSCSVSMRIKVSEKSDTFPESTSKRRCTFRLEVEAQG
jgi:hypothetical protein